MAKQAKIKQTDWTKGGRDISNTAIPLYQQNLNQLGDYLSNVQNRMDPYIDKYVDLQQASKQSDLLRNYQRAMSDMTGSNYAATTGGYSTLNQQNYDDYQRYYNDLAAKMYAEGLNSAANLAQEEYAMLANTPSVYNQAYGLGQKYSDIDQYNDLVQQNKDNWWSNLLTSAGDSIGSISMQSNNPYVQAIGGTVGHVMGTAGRMTGTDTSGAMSYLRGGSGGTTGGQYASASDSNANMVGGLSNLFGNYDWFKNNPFTKKSSGGSSSTSSESSGSQFSPSFMGWNGLGG